MFSLPLLTYIQQGDLTNALAYLGGCFIIIFLVLPFHEYAHGFAASKLGDPTPRYSGRLSLNPMRHIDWMGAVLVLVAGVGWAKPVPVNLRYFKRPKWDMALTALAGPLSNLLLALVALLLQNGLWALLTVFHPTWLVQGVGATVLIFLSRLLTVVASLNVSLAVFNLLPVPPLDGSRLLTALLPNHLYYRIMQYEQYIMIGLFFLIFMGVFDVPLQFMRSAALNGLSFVADLPFFWL